MLSWASSQSNLRVAVLLRLKLPRPRLAQGRQFGHHRRVFAVVFRGHAVEYLGVVVGRLATHSMHAKSGVAQRLPQGIAIRARRFHRHRHGSIPCQNLQKSYQRHDLRRVLHLPRPFERPIGPTRHRENLLFPDIHPNMHIPLRGRLQNSLQDNLLDSRRTIRSSLTHGGDLLLVGLSGVY